MEYRIAVYNKDRDSRCLLVYKASITPRIGEKVYFPHFGLYTVEEVVYNISDDRNSEDEEIMFIDIVVEKS